jgi:hypothetical protein
MRYRVLATVVAAACATGLAIAAQSRPPSAPDVFGTWDPMAGAAAGRCFPNGEDCPWKLEEIPLNDRAVAHRETFDETIAPKYDCVEATTPGIVADPYMMSLERRADRVLLRYEKDDVTRTAWLDGRTPPPNEYTWHGFSTARFEGTALVVETTNFLYDPTGLDDMAGLPSSTRKRVIERYTRDGDLLRATVATDDPLFLVAPAVYSTAWRRAPAGARMEKYECDAAEARQPLQFLPAKYTHTRTVPKRWQ